MVEIRYIATINRNFLIKNMDRVYLILAAIGLVIPYSIFINWLLNNGVNFNLFWQGIVEHPIGLFAWLDVFIAAVSLMVYVIYQRTHYSVKQVSYVISGTCLVGVSFSLPLLLYFNEVNKQQKQAK